jgi:hypothetical protein
MAPSPVVAVATVSAPPPRLVEGDAAGAGGQRRGGDRRAQGVVDVQVAVAAVGGEGGGRQVQRRAVADRRSRR